MCNTNISDIKADYLNYLASKDPGMEKFIPLEDYAAIVNIAKRLDVLRPKATVDLEGKEALEAEELYFSLKMTLPVKMKRVLREKAGWVDEYFGPYGIQWRSRMGLDV